MAADLPAFEDEAEVDVLPDRERGGATAAVGFRDFMLKPEIIRAITECGFETPSEVQQEAIPAAVNGKDVICQAKSGMGKTADVRVVDPASIGAGGWASECFGDDAYERVGSAD